MSTFCLSAALLVSALVLGQESNSNSSAPPAALVRQRSGAPLCVIQLDERVHDLGEGHSAVELTKSRTCRDSSGRLRIEVLQPSGEPSTITLLDPAEKSAVVLVPAGRVAYRIQVPRNQESEAALGLLGLGEALPAGNWKVTGTEPLGDRMIDGIDFVGSRITEVSDNPAMTASYERWYSNELGLTALAVASGPNWKHTVKVSEIQRREADPSEFVVPPGYNLHEIGH